MNKRKKSLLYRLFDVALHWIVEWASLASPQKLSNRREKWQKFSMEFLILSPIPSPPLLSPRQSQFYSPSPFLTHHLDDGKKKGNNIRNKSQIVKNSTLFFISTFFFFCSFFMCVKGAWLRDSKKGRKIVVVTCNGVNEMGKEICSRFSFTSGSLFTLCYTPASLRKPQSSTHVSLLKIHILNFW